MDGAGKVFAQIPEFSADVKKKLAEGKLRYISAAFFGKLRDGGKITPALFDKAVTLDAGLGDEQRKEYRALFDGLNAVADLSGGHAAPKPKTADAGGGTLAAKIRAFQKEKNIATFAEAAEAVYAANPALFEDEGGGASRGGEA
jgi:hypothetical protein